MQPSLAALKAEIENDPTSQGYSGKSPGEQAKLINERDITGDRSSMFSDVYRHLADVGLLSRFRDIAHGDDAPLIANHDVRSACMYFIEPKLDSFFDPNNGAITRMLNQLVTDGVLNPPQRRAIREVGGTLISRAEELWGVDTVIRWQRIVEALAS